MKICAGAQWCKTTDVYRIIVRKNADIENVMIKSNVPGPGTYEPATNLSNVGKYPLST